MLKRLLAGTSALALAAIPLPSLALSGSQVIPQNTAPIDNPNAYTSQQLLRLPNDAMGAGATVGGRLIVVHAASNAIVAKTPIAIGHFHRDGFAAANDGGAADFTGKPGACPLNGGAGDGGSQLPMADGCVYVDWASVGNVATPMLFESMPTATDDTAAIAAAIATTKTTYLPALTRSGIGNEWIVSSDIPVATQGQRIYGDGLRVTRIRVTTASGFTKGVFVYSTGEPGPIFHDLGVYFTRPNALSISQITQYKPAFYAENTPRTRWDRVGAYSRWDCFDWTSGGGGNYCNDIQMSPWHYGVNVGVDASGNGGTADTDYVSRLYCYPFTSPARPPSSCSTPARASVLTSAASTTSPSQIAPSSPRTPL